MLRLFPRDEGKWNGVIVKEEGFGFRFPNE